MYCCKKTEVEDTGSVSWQTDPYVSQGETALWDNIQLLWTDVQLLCNEALQAGAECIVVDNQNIRITGLSTFFLFQTLLLFLSQHVKKSKMLSLLINFFLSL